MRAIEVVFNFSGGLLDLKGFPDHHRPAVSVDTLQPRAVLQRLYGDPDDRWIFTADRAWIEEHAAPSKAEYIAADLSSRPN